MGSFHPPAEKLDEIESGLVRPMDVFDDHDRRSKGAAHQFQDVSEGCIAVGPE